MKDMSYKSHFPDYIGMASKAVDFVADYHRNKNFGQTPRSIIGTLKDGAICEEVKKFLMINF